MTGEPFEFGPFRLDAMGVVWRDGRPLPIGGRGVRLLEVLLRHRGAVVTKADLFDAAWPGETVEEGNLSVQIAQLRKRLGANWIRSVERVGYQWVDEPQPGSAHVLPSLSVRPFKDLGGGADVANALTDDLTTGLARFGSLQVLASAAGARTADYVLEGSVRREEGRFQVTVRLAERRSGGYCWADRFEVERASQLPIGLIASVVDGRVELAEVVASRHEGTGPETASDLFRQAQWFNRTLPDANAKAIALLEQALLREHDNPHFLATMCETIALRISMGWRDIAGVDADRLLGYALHGLRQPTANTDLLAQFGFGLVRAGDPERGYALMRRAADLNPNNPNAVCLAGYGAVNSGRFAEGEADLRRGLSLDPSHRNYGALMGGLSRLSMARGDFEGALRWAGRAHRANPHHGGSHWTLVAANAMLGRAEDAALSLEKFRIDHPGVTIERIRSGQPNHAPLSSTLEGLERAGMA